MRFSCFLLNDNWRINGTRYLENNRSSSGLDLFPRTIALDRSRLKSLPRLWQNNGSKCIVKKPFAWTQNPPSPGHHTYDPSFAAPPSSAAAPQLYVSRVKRCSASAMIRIRPRGNTGKGTQHREEQAEEHARTFSFFVPAATSILIIIITQREKDFRNLEAFSRRWLASL